MNDRNLTPDSIVTQHIKDLDEVFQSRFNMPLDSLLVYIIDTVNSSALQYLAQQFDVLGYKGYILATTDAQRRAVIKQAIELKRYMGTLYAIRQALTAAGYGSEAVINEGIGTVGDGRDWARFDISIDLGSGGGVSAALTAEATRLINEYKNVRSHLMAIAYHVSDSDDYPAPSEVLDGDDSSSAIIVDYGDDTEAMPDYAERLYLDGTWTLAGLYNLDGYKNDVIDFQIL